MLQMYTFLLLIPKKIKFKASRVISCMPVSSKNAIMLFLRGVLMTMLLLRASRAENQTIG